MTTNNSPSPFINFYDPFIKAPDHEGRTLLAILAWPDSKLELCHDYIQQLFPLPESSPVNPYAPIISPVIFAAFRQRPALRGQLRQSFERLLKFYGLELRDRSVDVMSGYMPIVVKAPNFETASRNWVTRFDHNHLRITRIIRCLRVLGLEKEAEAFFLALGTVYEECAGKISRRSLVFWTRAAKRPLWLVPENEDDGGVRSGFLWEFEKGRKNKERGREIKGSGKEETMEASSSKINGADKEDCRPSRNHRRYREDEKHP